MSLDSVIAGLSPSAWWKLDETSGTVMSDSSGNGQNGTYVNGPTLGATPAFPGSGTAVLFDGTNDRASVPTSTSVNASGSSGGAQPFTLLVAGKLTNPAANALQVIADKSGVSATNGQWSIYWDNRAATGSPQRLGIINGSGTVLTWQGASASAAMSAGFVIMARWDTTTNLLTLWVNGTQVASGSRGNFLSTLSNTRQVDVGCLNGAGTPSSFLNGRLDYLALVQSAISDAEYAAVVSETNGTAGVPVGSASGTFQWAGSAAGVTAKRGTASGAFAWAGVANGSTVKSGAASGAFEWSGSAVGVAPTVGLASGTASGAFSWVGTATGSTLKSGTASGTFGWVGAATGTAPTAGLPGVLYVSSPSPRFSTVLLAEGGETWDADMLRVSSRTERGSAVTLILTPSAVPLVINEWPVMRQAHVMPALTAAAPRMRPHVDYAVDMGEVGRDHVWVDGVDVTFLRNAPTIIGETVESAPMGDDRASIEFPQIKPWDEPGTGDLSMLREDAPVEVALIRPDGSRVHRFDGFVSSFSDYSGDGREAYTVQCEGVLAQAMHTPWEPPLFLDETDIGILIPRALNAVPGRRWRKIPETVTGFTSRDRGSQDSSVWQQVQNWLAPAWTLDGRQLMLKRYAHGVYRLELKAATSTVHWTVTKGAPGVGVDLIHDSSTRRDSVYGRGVAPDGGTWANWFFPFLDAFVPQPYPMAGFANMSVGTTDAMTTTRRGVSDWQRRMRDLGYPVTVDGVMNSADTKWVRRVQSDRGLTVDGSLGPQTWNGTFDPGPTEVDLRAVRRPMATKPAVEQYLYAANGARTRKNPAWDSRIIRHAMPGVNFGTGIRKSEAFAPSASILAREGTTGAAGRITLKTDPHEADSSRLFIRAGDNVEVIGHRGATVVQVADVSHGTLESTLTVDERARDALAVEAILERNRDARNNPSNRPGKAKSTDLDRADVVQYESESKAGVLPRYAVNGNSGLWSVLPMFVSQVGVAKVELTATSPKAEIICALFSRPVRPNVLESLLPDPLTSAEGWYDNVERLKDKHGLMEVFGTPSSPGGYWPRQKDKGALTGVLKDSSGTLYDSGYGGVVWVALFTSRSTWVQGRIFPAVPQ